MLIKSLPSLRVQMATLATSRVNTSHSIMSLHQCFISCGLVRAAQLTKKCKALPLPCFAVLSCLAIERLPVTERWEKEREREREREKERELRAQYPLFALMQTD